MPGNKIHVALSAVISNFKKTAVFSRGQKKKKKMIQIKRMHVTLVYLNTEIKDDFKFALEDRAKKDVQLNYIYMHTKTRW